MTSESPIPTPADLRELQARAAALLADITAAEEALGDSRAATRLSMAAQMLPAVVTDLETAAGTLARERSVPGTACDIPWGACPEHGRTLTSSAGTSWCTVCGRRWNYDRLAGPCTDPAVATVTTANDGDKTLRMCAAHLADAGRHLIGAIVTPIPAP